MTVIFWSWATDTFYFGFMTQLFLDVHIANMTSMTHIWLIMIHIPLTGLHLNQIFCNTIFHSNVDDILREDCRRMSHASG